MLLALTLAPQVPTDALLITLVVSKANALHCRLVPLSPNAQQMELPKITDVLLQLPVATTTSVHPVQSANSPLLLAPKLVWVMNARE